MTKTNQTIDATIQNAEYDPWGVHKTFHYKGYEFIIFPRDIESYDSPKLMVISPSGYINTLPKLKGFRRNTVREWYTVKGKSEDTIMKSFLTAFESIIDTPENTLYHNKPIREED